MTARRVPTSSSLTRLRRLGLLLALVVLTLASCGTRFHPGDAAVVDGSAIRASQVDDLVLAACDYAQQVRLSQGGAVPAQSTANLRANLIQALIQFVLTDRAAAQLGVTASDARVAQVAATAKMPTGVSDQTRGLLTQYFHDSARAQLLQAAIGAHLRDPKITTADAVSPNDISAARPYLDKFAGRQSVTVDPSFGRWNGTRVVNTSGSLSVPATVTPPPPGSGSAAAVKDLPQSQVCG